MKDLAELAKRTGIDVSEFQRVLNPVTSEASTIEDARKEYFDAEAGSGEERAALRRWISLCATFTDLTDAYEETGYGSEEDRLALLKMIELYEKE